MRWLRRLQEFCRDALDEGRPGPSPRLVVTPDVTRPHTLAAAHVQAAREAFRQADWEACAASAQAALAHDSRDVSAAFFLGQARLRQRRFDEAQAAFRQAVGGGDPFGLAAAWVRRAEAGEAAEQRLWPGRHVAQAIELERAARAALRNGEPRRARQLSAEATELDPANLMAHHHLGQALLALGLREAALAAYEAARPYEHGLGVVDGWIETALRASLDEEQADD